MGYSDRNFMIFNVSEIDKINFDEVLQNSAQWMRKSVDNQKTFVKWDGNTVPSSVQTLTTSEGPYNYDEITNILNSSDWVEITTIVPSIF
jgi:hypothetical protein